MRDKQLMQRLLGVFIKIPDGMIKVEKDVLVLAHGAKVRFLFAGVQGLTRSLLRSTTLSSASGKEGWVPNLLLRAQRGNRELFSLRLLRRSFSQ